MVTHTLSAVTLFGAWLGTGMSWWLEIAFGVFALVAVAVEVAWHARRERPLSRRARSQGEPPPRASVDAVPIESRLTQRAD
jgi:hypothetical protein